MRPPVTVVGNGVSGFACARRLAEHDVPVTLVGPGLPCDRPLLTKRALAVGRLPQLADADQVRDLGIAALDGVATGCDTTTRTLAVTTSAGEPVEHHYDGELVWATGVAVTGPSVPGAELADCNATPAGFERVLPRVSETVPGRRVVVIGAGLIGCETAATLASRHTVTLLERASAPLMRMPPMVAAAAIDGLAEAGVAVIGDCLVERIERNGDQLLVHTDGRILTADVVLAATGVGRALPADVGEGLGIATDAHLSLPGEDRTWACGDVAVFPHPRFGRLAIPHWDHALASGRHVADSIAGGPAPYERDPYWFSDIGRVRIQVVGHEPAVAEWRRVDELLLGVDTGGRVACVALVNQPARIREARGLVTPNAGSTKEVP